MSIIGLFFMADPLDEDSKPTIKYMENEGIIVKMVTGDNQIIAKKVCSDLELSGDILLRNEMIDELNNNDYTKLNNVAAFSEILPEDKQKLVESFRGYGYSVASTGDGVNDLPALKTANIGIAVANAVPALKSTADIVLTEKGISVIKNAINESRSVFQRVYNYTVYRISESFRLIITILILGL
jgi:H+-transporting ATPase